MKTSTILCGVALLCTLNTTAQENSNTLSECLERGLANNYSLRIVRNEEKVSENNATMANAGLLPTLDASAGYSGTLNNTDITNRDSEQSTSSSRNITDHTLRAGIDLAWTVFDGFKMQADYKRLKELHLLTQVQTRIAIEDFIAEFTSEYYNFVKQRLRLKNLNYAVKLSRERLRIVQDRYIIGDNSRLDLLQARVDFNADSADCLKQAEQLITSRIRLIELMGGRSVDSNFAVADTAIYTDSDMNFAQLWEQTQANNASLIAAAHEKSIASADMKSIMSRDYPYMKLNAGYGYTQNRYETGSIKKRNEWGADFGITIGMKIFDGNRRRERRNARLAIENAELQQQNIELSLYSDLNRLWQSYVNNRQLLNLERQNVVAARQNYDIAYERYLLGNLSGIEMREAQKSLLDAEERILEAEYNTKVCEISLLQISGNVTTYLKQHR